jgi:hypothetical protein
MLIKMPYVFHAEVVPAGKRNAVSLAFGNHMDLEIAELSDDEAPLVMEWSQRSSLTNRTETMMGRVSEGQFYAAIKNGDGTFLHAENLLWDHIHTFPDDSGSRGEKPISQFISGKLTHTLSDYRSCTRSNEETIREEVMNAAAGMMIADGLVYERHRVPLLRTSVESFQAGERLTLGIEYDTVSFGGTNILHFSIQDMDKAVSWAEEVVQASAGQLTFRNLAEVVVHRPDLLPEVDYFTMDLCRTLDVVLSSAGKTLFIMPDHFIDAWQDLRRARNALHPGCSGELVDEAITAWSAYVESNHVVERERCARLGQEYYPERETEHRMRAYFLPRWEAHEIQLDIGADFGRRPQI